MKQIGKLFGVLLLAGGLFVARGEWIVAVQERLAPTLEGLDAALLAWDAGVPLESVNFWGFFNRDEGIQGEVQDQSKQRFPKLMAETAASAGNIPNLKMVALRQAFAESLLRTPTVAALQSFLATLKPDKNHD